MFCSIWLTAGRVPLPLSEFVVGDEEECVLQDILRQRMNVIVVITTVKTTATRINARYKYSVFSDEFPSSPTT